MTESTTLTTMESIKNFCREIELPCSERLIIQMHREQGFPLLQNLDKQWESDKDLIRAWRKERIIKRRIDLSYIQERGQFIAEAKAYADRIHGATPKAKRADRKKSTSEDEWAAQWNLSYHAQMNRLWHEYVQKKYLAASYAQEEAHRIYEEKLAELMGRK